MAIDYAQMIGTRGEVWKYPALSIAGKRYTRPAITISLPDNKFVVGDNSLSVDDREQVLADIRKYIAPKRKKRTNTEVEVLDDNETER